MPRMKTVASQKPLSEITLRKYETPKGLDERELTKKFCLTIGLLNPGDSRDVIVDILHEILFSKKPLTASEIRQRVEFTRRSAKRPATGCAMSNVLRQLRRLKESLLIEKHLNTYRVSENDTLTGIFQEKVQKFRIESIIQRALEYTAELDKRR